MLSALGALKRWKALLAWPVQTNGVPERRALLSLQPLVSGLQNWHSQKGTNHVMFEQRKVRSVVLTEANLQPVRPASCRSTRTFGSFSALWNTSIAAICQPSSRSLEFFQDQMADLCTGHGAVYSGPSQTAIFANGWKRKKSNLPHRCWTVISKLLPRLSCPQHL